MSELENFGRNLRRLRRAQGLNQSDLAALAKTRPSTISAIETGVSKNPGWILLNRIAEALSSSVHNLLAPTVEKLQREKLDSLTDSLKKALQNQNTYLSMSESRVSYRELEWLEKIPEPTERQLKPEEYFMILRHLRLFY